jgi:hypothetical protein
MKISIAASILILLVAALFGVPNHQRLVSIRESHAKLVATAAQLGIAVKANTPEEALRVTKRTRDSQEVDAKAFLADWAAFSREMKVIQEKGDAPDEALQKRSLEIIERMESLDAAQMKLVIAEACAAKDLDDETRQNIIGFFIMTLSDNHPQAALDLSTESSDLFSGNALGDHLMLSLLAKWAKDDPQTSVEWVKKNSAKFPNLITADAKHGLISGVAAQDPKLAFRLIGELGITDTSQSVGAIIFVSKTPEERMATLNALREHLATLPDGGVRAEISKNAVRGLASITVGGGFEASTRWIADANLTASELESFAGGLNGSIRTNEAGKWIEWLGDTLPRDKADKNISNLVRHWAQKDYQAAGQWLVSAPAGPAKDAAIQSYSSTISEYEPTIAAQWAVTLPPGTGRDETLKSIYRNWPKEDATAREAFKQEHGIK